MARFTDCADAQVETLRSKLLEVAARVVVSVRRIAVHLPKQFPGLAAWQQIALAAGGRSP